jgi:hypothetical protein
MLGNPSAFLVDPLNRQWSALYFEDDWLQQPSTIQVLLTLSQEIPLLHFNDAEDHGWGYRIFAEGREQAQFHDDYSLDQGMVIALAETRYPDIEVEPFLYLEEEGQRVFQQLLQEVRQSEQFQAAYAKQFERKHVEAFSYFEVDSEKIEQLNQLISPDGLQSEPPRNEEVSKFKTLLGITQMEWKSYHYMKPEQNLDQG